MKQISFIMLGLIYLLMVITCSSPDNNVTDTTTNSTEIKKINCVFINELSQTQECEEYYENGNVKLKAQYKNGILQGDYLEYHPNGKIRIKGEYLRGEKYNYFDYYDSLGNKIKEENYAVNLFTEELQLNEYIYYDSKGNIIREKSHYFNIFLDDTIKLGESFEAKIVLVAPFYKEKMHTYINIYKKGLGDLATKPAIKHIGENFIVNYKHDKSLEIGEYYLLGYIDDYKDTLVDNQVKQIGKRLFIYRPFAVIGSAN
jgi:hypothetical protein